MERTEWVKMIEENEEKIIEKANEAYTKAASGTDKIGMTTSLIMDSDGTLRISQLLAGNFDGAVFNKEAIYIYTVKDFNLFDLESNFIGLKWNDELGGYVALPDTWMANEIGTDTLVPEEMKEEVLKEVINDLILEGYGFDYEEFLYEFKQGY